MKPSYHIAEGEIVQCPVNILWFIFAGIWLAIGHVLSALACAISIIGIPFAIQHLKLAGIALAPIGKTIVTKEVAEAARRRNAEVSVSQLRGGYQ